MPEGPECRRITDKLRESAKGKTFLFIEFFQNAGSTKYIDSIGPIWDQIKPHFPSTCSDLICRGKQIFFFFENGFCFYGGLGMEGHWYRFNRIENEKAYRLRSREGSPDRTYPKFCLHFGQQNKTKDKLIASVYKTTVFLWYDDKRCFGNFNIGSWQDGFNKMEELGPDLIAASTPIENIHPYLKRLLPESFFEKISFERFSQILTAQPNKNICKVLLDSKKLSGIGNYLKSEILYRAKISPFRTVGSLSPNELSTLYGVILNTILQAYRCGGLTHGTFLDPDFEKGTFHKIVYKQDGECDPHGYQILFTKEIDNRGTYYVPQIQK